MTSGTKGDKATTGFFTPGRIVLLVVAGLTLIFIFVNTKKVDIRLLIPEVTMPLWLALFGPAAIGFLCGFYFRRRR
jgi:uncharacterized integral membrane protein